MNDVTRAILENVKAYATAYAKAYLALTEAGLSPELAQNEARVLGFMAVSPDATTPPAGLPGFGPRSGDA
ncbi:MAG TPA: hypothetical protein VNA25_02080 [Phycisphaerae bacterium]|nr:hypothetical protein [Phycisphaerae bacterium]